VGGGSLGAAENKNMPNQKEIDKKIFQLKCLGKIGLAVVFISFFMPLRGTVTHLDFILDFFALYRDGMSVSYIFELFFREMHMFFLCISFFTSFAGSLLIIPLLFKKNLKAWTEWVFLIVSILAAIAEFTSRYYENYIMQNYLTIGLFILIIGYAISVTAFIILRKTYSISGKQE
jgi:hypothetical protein